MCEEQKRALEKAIDCLGVCALKIDAYTKKEAQKERESIASTGKYYAWGMSYPDPRIIKLEQEYERARRTADSAQQALDSCKKIRT